MGRYQLLQAALRTKQAAIFRRPDLARVCDFGFQRDLNTYQLI